MSAADAFRRLGFAIVPGLLDAVQCAQLGGQLPSIQGPGTRTLLANAWCARLARRVLHFLFAPACMPQGIEWREQEGGSHETCRHGH
jgi:hypothetical protein